MPAMTPTPTLTCSQQRIVNGQQWYDHGIINISCVLATNKFELMLGILRQTWAATHSHVRTAALNLCYEKQVNHVL